MKTKFERDSNDGVEGYSTRYSVSFSDMNRDDILLLVGIIADRCKGNRHLTGSLRHFASLAEMVAGAFGEEGIIDTIRNKKNDKQKS